MVPGMPAGRYAPPKLPLKTLAYILVVKGLTPIQLYTEVFSMLATFMPLITAPFTKVSLVASAPVDSTKP